MSLIESETNTPWTNFIKETRDKFSTIDIQDASYIPFPSYTLLINLGNIKTNNDRCRKTFVLNLSLLTNYFTCYFEDVHDFFNDNERKGNSNVSVVYATTSHDTQDKILLDAVKSIIPGHFPDYEFVAHHLLFNTKISGVTTYTSPELIHNPVLATSIYELLFSHELFVENYKVLE